MVIVTQVFDALGQLFVKQHTLYRAMVMHLICSSLYNPRRACAARVTVCLCCLSVTTLAAASFISTRQLSFNTELSWFLVRGF